MLLSVNINCVIFEIVMVPFMNYQCVKFDSHLYFLFLIIKIKFLHTNVFSLFINQNRNYNVFNLYIINSSQVLNT